MNFFNILKRPMVIIFVVMLVCTLLLVTLSYRLVAQPLPQVRAVAGPPVATVTVGSTSTATSTSSATLLPAQEPAKILGLDGDIGTGYAGIPWVRLSYPSCGWGNLSGDVLKKTIETYHKAGIRVLLTICQGPDDARLYDTKRLNDVAQGQADAVQCGNEEMKLDPAVAFLYIPPENFARFYDLCERAVHTVRPDIPVLLGSLDPHVGGVDYQPLLDQVDYLDRMQAAMNNTVHPGGQWDWHTQKLGLIDSWHNGYPDGSVNSLYGLFSFWSQQFQVDLDSGQLGKHLWVVEGTGCFKGCGIDSNNAAQVAISHILTLVTDVQTAMKYSVPFFYFSDRDFIDQGYYWPIGVLDIHGHPKPLRQDLAMGARRLIFACPTGNSSIVDQVQLLIKLYSRCTLPGNYMNTIAK